MENYKEKEEIYSRRVKAGKRTYFFDIKATRSEDFYLTITESKKRLTPDGFFYEKHKIFLYKEDFVKFVEALNDCVDYVKEELMPEYDFDQFNHEDEEEGLEEGSQGGYPKESYSKQERTPREERTPKLDRELSWE